MRSIVDPDLFIADVPHDLFDEARAVAPVQWIEVPTELARSGLEAGSGFWSVTGHAAAREALGDQKRFSSAKASIFLEDQSDGALAAQRLMMLVMDPPEHTDHRLTVNRRFVPRAVERLRADIGAIVDGAIDRIAPLGEADFVSTIAAEVPLLVIADLLGVERDDREAFHRWSDTIINAQDPEFAIGPADVALAIKELMAYGAERLAARRAEPRDDLLTALAHAEIDGVPLDLERQAAFWYLFLLAGNETTRQALSGAMIAFHRFPDQRRLLVERPELLDSAVEEIVRWWTPVHHFRRTATEDTTLGGEPVAAGDKVILWFSAANRDPAVFADPHRVDITRSPNEHLAFGQGAHFCLGAHLARLELRLTIEALLRRLPDIALAGEPERARGNFVNAVKRLPVAFTPAA
ncbi:MAG: cytochrome P450 [Acidimicrobiia bacterium]|nr:cytochrome P450 [Acidimicrobiia bacterium]